MIQAKYYWSINIAKKLLHDNYCKYIYVKGKNKDKMCKKRTNVANGFVK